MSDIKTLDPTKSVTEEEFIRLLNNPPASSRWLAERVRGAMGGLQQLRNQRTALNEAIIRQEGAVSSLQQLLIEHAAEAGAKQEGIE